MQRSLGLSDISNFSLTLLDSGFEPQRRLSTGCPCSADTALEPHSIISRDHCEANDNVQDEQHAIFLLFAPPGGLPTQEICRREGLCTPQWSISMPSPSWPSWQERSQSMCLPVNVKGEIHPDKHLSPKIMLSFPSYVSAWRGQLGAAEAFSCAHAA